jgi:CRP/FNR family cyclic AMP-dependent transcriptional regulator
MSLIDNEPHSATCRAEVQTDMLTLGRAEFARCLPENSSMSYAIMKGLVQRLRQADRKIESLALMDVYGRVARALLEFASPIAKACMTIRERISRQDIAKMVGASREMVSRVMKDLEDRGFIETREDGSMLVKDRLTHARLTRNTARRCSARRPCAKLAPRA